MKAQVERQAFIPVVAAGGATTRRHLAGLDHGGQAFPGDQGADAAEQHHIGQSDDRFELADAAHLVEEQNA